MELLVILGVLAPAIFAGRSFYDTIQKFLGEKDFEKELTKLLKDEQFKIKLQGLIKDVSEQKDDPRVLAEADALFGEALEHTDERARLSVQEGLRQPSERGRLNYVSKLLKDVTSQTGQNSPTDRAAIADKI